MALHSRARPSVNSDPRHPAEAGKEEAPSEIAGISARWDGGGARVEASKMRARVHPQVRGRGSSNLDRSDEAKGHQSWGRREGGVTEYRHVRRPLALAAAREPRQRHLQLLTTTAAPPGPSARHAAFSVGGQTAARPAPLSRAPRKWSRDGAGAGSERGRRRRAAG